MPAAWLAIAVLLQGVPVQPQQGGTIAGILRDTEGRPFPGARIAAVPQPGDAGTIPDASAMSALAQTDAEGRYRLENVPPGKYYIAAGSVYLPTFYPGTQEAQDGIPIAVAAGATISGIDFRIEDTSVRVPDGLLTSVMLVPVDIRVEGGGEVPVFGPAGLPRISMTAPGKTTPTVTVALGNASSIALPGPSANLKVRVENLPQGYSVKSMSFDRADLLTGNLRISAGTFAATLSKPAPRLSVLLSRTTSAGVPNGVRVTGRAMDSTLRQVFISGIAGVSFRDGSFEFLNVPPGRHSIVAFEATERNPAAASVVVGDEDVQGLRLEPASMMPRGIRALRAPGPAGAFTPGTTIPLATLRGTITDAQTRQPIASGSAFIRGDSGATLDLLDEAGRFEFYGLLPGTYALEIRLVDHVAEPRTITIGNGDVTVEIGAEKPKD